MSEVDIDALIRRRGPPWRWLIPLAVAVAAGAGVGAFLLLQPDEPGVVTEPQRAEAETGRLSTTVDLSGAAAAERSAELSFEAAGTVTSVAVGVGDSVRAGDTLAAIDDSAAALRVETAAVQLRLAELRLEALLADPQEADVASARQSIASARSQVASAEQALARLLEPPEAGDLASAEQAVANALSQLSSAEEALAALSEPPEAGDLASAEQAVASTLGQLSSAEEALAALSEPPEAGELASAEQAVASALGQLLSAEEALDTLLAGPSEAETDSGRSAVTQAQAQVTSATSRAEDSLIALEEAFDRYCDLYGYLRVADQEVCGAALPLSDGHVAVVRDSLDGRSSAYQRQATGLMAANLAFVADEAAREAAVAALSSAEERLAELVAPAQAEDVRQAELAVEAARASHAAAEARLADLGEESSGEDVRQAELAVEAARASHAAAEARLADLGEESSAEDVYQAELAVEAARASHAASVARFEEVSAPAGEGEVGQARASLESARAALATAQARFDELMAGATENAVEQQRESVRLAEISLAEARSALDDLSVVAPFDGIVEAVNVGPGDRVTANLAAFSLSTTDRVLVELTVTEADLPDLEVGQAGLASFDALSGVEYPVRITSITRVPEAAQGVVTYEAEARILSGPEIAEVAGDLAVLGGAGAGGLDLGAMAGPGGPGMMPPGFELPEGVTLRDILQAAASGGPLPEGVTLPEGLDIAPEDMQRIAAGLLGGRGGRGAGGPAALPGARPLPAPGMSASVTILTELREPAVLVPVSAVRQIDGAWHVAVPARAGAGTGFERVAVELGESDGTSVEIAAGLEAGAVVLIGADSAGAAFSATQSRRIPGPDLSGFPGVGPPGGRP